MNEQERELDLMVAELEQENRLLRARNERLEREALADIGNPITEQPDMNLSCKSVQARLATSWGYVKAEQPAQTATYTCGVCGVSMQMKQSAQQQEPYEIDWPEYHEHAMGCGLEDREEYCRYGAMRYGWDCAIEAVAQAIPNIIYTSPPAQRKPLTDEQIEEIRIEQEFDQWAISEAVFKYAARAIEAAHGIKG